MDTETLMSFLCLVSRSAAAPQSPRATDTDPNTGDQPLCLSFSPSSAPMWISGAAEDNRLTVLPFTKVGSRLGQRLFVLRAVSKHFLTAAAAMLHHFFFPLLRLWIFVRLSVTVRQFDFQTLTQNENVSVYVMSNNKRPAFTELTKREKEYSTENA